MTKRPTIHNEPPPVTGKKYQFVETASRYSAGRMARDMKISEMWVWEDKGKLWAAWVVA